MSTESWLLPVALAALAGGGVGYWISSLRLTKRLEGEIGKRESEQQSLRAVHSQKLETERKDAMLQVERARAQERAAFQAEIEKIGSTHAGTLRETIQKYEEKLKLQVENDITVTLYPFVTTQTKKNWFGKEKSVEIGHRYQLFVRGIPCFEPHTVVVEELIEKEVDEKRLDELKDKAFLLAEAVVNANSAGIAGKFVTIAKAVSKRF